MKDIEKAFAQFDTAWRKVHKIYEPARKELNTLVKEKNELHKMHSRIYKRVTNARGMRPASEEQITAVEHMTELAYKATSLINAKLDSMPLTPREQDAKEAAKQEAAAEEE